MDVASNTIPLDFEFEVLCYRIEHNFVAAQAFVFIAGRPEWSIGALGNGVPNKFVVFVNVESCSVTTPAILCGIPVPAGYRVMLQMEASRYLFGECPVHRVSLEFFPSSSLVDQIRRRPSRRTVTRNTVGRVCNGVDDVTIGAGRPCPAIQGSTVAQRTGTPHVSCVVVADQVGLLLPRPIHKRNSFSVPVHEVLFARVVRVKGGMGGPRIVPVVEGAVEMAAFRAFTAPFKVADRHGKGRIAAGSAFLPVAPLAALYVLLGFASVVDGKPPGKGRLQGGRMHRKGRTWGGVTCKAAGDQGRPVKILSMTELAEEKIFVRICAVNKAIYRAMDGIRRGGVVGAGQTARNHAAEDQQGCRPDSASHSLPFPAR